MKKINFFSIAVIALAGLFCGCSNITEAKSEAAESDTMVVKLALDEMRAIKAVEYNVSDVKDWTLTFTGTILGTEKTYGFSTTANDEDSKAVWDNSSSFTVKKIPTGTYSLKITGTGTDSSSNSFTLCGSKTGFTVSADSVTNDAVDIHLKSESTGSLILTLSTTELTEKDESLTANNIGYFKAVLTPAGGVNNGDAVELTSADGIEVDNSGNVVLSKTEIPSGWYVLKFEFNDGTNQYKYRINEYNVQIADDIITTATETLFCVTQETYYATNSTSTYNGKSKAYPANLTNLLGNLAASLPDVTDISIYMTDADEDAEIDVATITELQTAVSKNIDEKKYTSISIYNSSDTENAVLLVNNSNSDVTGVETVISGSVTVSATDNNTDFAVSSVTQAASSMIVTLKNGAVLNTQSINFNNSSIAFRAVDSDESADNFTAYVSSPFVTYLSTDAESIEKSLLLYAYNGTAALDTWSCICKEETTGSDSDATTTYSVYTVPASGATSSIVNLAETAVITAADDSSSYTSGSKITYTDADLTFSLSGLEGVEPSSYQWQLNGSVVGTDSTLVLNPTEAEAILPDEENTLACYIVVNSTVYIAEMTFTFKADYNTNAVYVDSETPYKSVIMQTSFDDSAAGTTVMADTSTSAYYTFDAEGNMYVATWGNSLSLYKYVKTVSSGNFSSTWYVFNEFTDITTQPAYADICYDTVNGLVYVLWTIADTSNNTTTYTSKVYAFTCSDTAFTSVADTEVSVPSAYTSTIAGKFSQIAVNGSDVYLADADLNVLKVDFSVSQTDSGVTVTPGTPSVLSLGTVLKTTVGIDSTKYDSNDWDSSEITDLIVGDGCGNESSTLYALVREASSSIYGGGDNDKYYFSRGALLAFDTLSTAATPTVYGWSTTETKLTQATDSTLCAPLYSETDAFYGPVHFACVMPKKLVIADDGFATKDSTGADKNLYNKDGFVVFDIEASSLTYQKASVTMSKPEQANYSSTFTIN